QNNSQSFLPNNINSKYNFVSSFDSLSKKRYLGIPKIEKRKFVLGMTYSLQYLYDYGYLISDWEEADNYLQNLFNKLVPESEFKRKQKIYILKEATVNAFATGNNHIFLNLGLLAHLKNEAALASIMGHEFAHNKLNHSEEYFLQNYKTYFKYKEDKLLWHYVLLYKKLRYNELKADSLGFEYCKAMGYNLYDISNTFQGFETQSTFYKSSYDYNSLKHQIYVDRVREPYLIPDSLDKYFSSHPENSTRIAALLRIAGRTNQKETNESNNPSFLKLRTEARKRVMELLYKNADYETATNESFLYFLSDTSSQENAYQVAESIRRFLYTHPELLNRGFITYNLKDEIFKDGSLGILHNLGKLSYDKALINYYNNYSFISKPAFETYKQAFNFFILKAGNHPEAKLSAGLFSHWLGDKNLSEKLLNEYNSLPQAKHKNFVNELLMGSKFKANHSSNRKFLVDNSTYFEIYQGNLFLNYKLAQKEFSKKDLIIESTTRNFPGTSVTLLSDFVNYLDKNEVVNWNGLKNHVQKFINQTEYNDLSREDIRDNNYWRNKSVTDPENTDWLKRKRHFFIWAPEMYSLFAENQISKLNILTINNYKLKSKKFNQYDMIELDPFGGVFKHTEMNDDEFYAKVKYENIMKQCITNLEKEKGVCYPE
ncbi:MAG: M48 family metallopeptidase, partial [Bacteroidia bacterium]|nr:M48 family metallopeptidase [Bacteroidia bacterium]